MPFKLAILNTGGGASGGAARAVYRLHHELLRQGVDSSMLAVDEFPPGDDSVHRLPDVGYRLSRWARGWAFRSVSKPWPEISLNRFSRVRVATHPLVQSSDLVMLGWIGADYLSPRQLGRIPKPVLWRLSDCWPFTGGCHYPSDCLGYERSCGCCPLLGAVRDVDCTSSQHASKSRAYKKVDLQIAAPSRWIQTVSQRSSLLKNVPIHLLPSGVDTNMFRIRDRESARRKLGLPSRRKVLMFGAINSTSNPRKGFAPLTEALRILAANGKHSDLHLVVFGDGTDLEMESLGLPSTSLGRLELDERLAAVYPAADVFVAPSLEENLPNTVMEAMACGIPCVAYPVGGLPDLIIQYQTGVLAEQTNAAGLAEAIAQALTVRPPAEAVRKHILENYDLRVQGARYIDLMQQMASGHARRAHVSTRGGGAQRQVPKHGE